MGRNGSQIQNIARHNHVPSQLIGDDGNSVITTLSRTVELAAAEVKGLPTTFAEIIPATEVLDYGPAPTTLFVPLHCQLIVHHDADFTNISDSPRPTLRLVMGSDWSLQVGRYIDDITTLGSDAISIIGAAENKFVVLDLRQNDLLPGVGLEGSVKDNGIYLAMTNGSAGDFTGGGSTTWTITVHYTVVDNL